MPLRICPTGGAVGGGSSHTIQFTRLLSNKHGSESTMSTNINKQPTASSDWSGRGGQKCEVSARTLGTRQHQHAGGTQCLCSKSLTQSSSPTWKRNETMSNHSHVLPHLLIVFYCALSIFIHPPPTHNSCWFAELHSYNSQIMQSGVDGFFPEMMTLVSGELLLTPSEMRMVSFYS